MATAWPSSPSNSTLTFAVAAVTGKSLPTGYQVGDASIKETVTYKTSVILPNIASVPVNWSYSIRANSHDDGEQAEAIFTLDYVNKFSRRSASGQLSPGSPPDAIVTKHYTNTNYGTNLATIIQISVDTYALAVAG
jgi:hypothetical protein